MCNNNRKNGNGILICNGNDQDYNAGNPKFKGHRKSDNHDNSTISIR